MAHVFESTGMAARMPLGVRSFEDVTEAVRARIRESQKDRTEDWFSRADLCISAMASIVKFRCEQMGEQLAAAEFEKLIDLRVVIGCLEKYIGVSEAAIEMVYKIQLYLLALPGYGEWDKERMTGHHQHVAFDVVAAVKASFVERWTQ